MMKRLPPVVPALTGSLLLLACLVVITGPAPDSLIPHKPNGGPSQNAAVAPRSVRMPSPTAMSAHKASASEAPAVCTIPQVVIEEIASSDTGQTVSIPAFLSDGLTVSGEVFMARSLNDGLWFRALRLQRFNEIEDAVLTVAKETNGEIVAMIVSQTRRVGWKQISGDTGEIVLMQVPRTAFLPECAGEVNGPPNGVPVGPPGAPPPLLQSLPGAARVIYLDFDGERVNDTQWNALYTSGAAIAAAAPNLTPTEVEKIWGEVSEDFRPFAVNVTTDRSVYDSAISIQRMALIVTPTTNWHDRSLMPGERSPAGITLLGSFGTEFGRVGWVFSPRLVDFASRAIACSHEFGHSFGLTHDEKPPSPYYAGHGELAAPTSWGPIMGAPYGRRLTQWNPSDYPGAFNVVADQDDTAILASKLGLRDDEDSDSQTSARNLRFQLGDTAVSHALKGEGIIGSRIDTDWFFVDIIDAPVVLRLDVKPFASADNSQGSNLDIRAALFSASNSLLQESNPPSDTRGAITYDIPVAGRYYLSIEGVGKNTTDGYSDYGSLGCYSVEGSYFFGTAPVIVRAPASLTRSIGQTAAFTVVASGTDPMAYQWQHRPNPQTPWAAIGANSPVLTLPSVSLSNAGDYRVMIDNGIPPGAISSTARLTVLAPPTATGLYAWSTFAGAPGGPGNRDGVTSLAGFRDPQGIAVDEEGVVYVADSGNHTIRKITTSGVVITLAGRAGQEGAEDGTGGGARFRSPKGIALDGAGNIVVADTGNHLIRKISPGGAVTTLAGSRHGPGSADGNGSNARFSSPGSLTVDSDGIVYIADTNNHTIRRLSSQGAVTTIAGVASEPGESDGAGNAARFHKPSGIAVDSSRTLFVADTENHAIRKISPGGQVTHFAGGYVAGSDDGPVFGGQNGTQFPRFNQPVGIAVNSMGQVFVADQSNYTIRKIDPEGTVTTIAGSPGQTGSADGIARSARFALPSGVAVSRNGDLLLADPGYPGEVALSNFPRSHTIRKITPAGVVTTYVGNPEFTDGLDGTGQAAHFSRPHGIAIDDQGVVYVVDTDNHTIRKITPDGVVTTIAGRVGEFGSTDGEGQAARFYYPIGIAVDTNRNLYVADTFNQTIRKITPAGIVSTLAGKALDPDSLDGNGSAARFLFPRGIAVDGKGTVFVAENQHVRKISADGTVSTLFAGDEPSYSINGIAVDRDGILFVTNTGHHTVLKILPNGTVTNVAGVSGQTGSEDGVGDAARFTSPGGIAMDSEGSLFVTDSSHTIRRITPNSVVRTIGGAPGQSGWEGGVASARFGSFEHLWFGSYLGYTGYNTFTFGGVAAMPDGTLFVADTTHNRIVKGVPLYSRDGGALTQSTDDSDGDGKTDLSELLAGTDPYDSSSGLSISSISITPSLGGFSLGMSFPAVQGVIYRIEYGTDLRGWKTIWGPETPTNGINVFNLESIPLPEGPTGFLRIAVGLDPYSY